MWTFLSKNHPNQWKSVNFFGNNEKIRSKNTKVHLETPPLTSPFWIKNGLKIVIWDFSTREDLRLVHQDHFENTARAGKNIGVPNLGENCGVLPRGSPQPRNFTATTPNFHWYLNLTQNQPRYRWKNWNLSQTSIKSKNKSEKYSCSKKYRVPLPEKIVFYQF